MSVHVLCTDVNVFVRRTAFCACWASSRRPQLGRSRAGSRICNPTLATDDDEPAAARRSAWGGQKNGSGPLGALLLAGAATPARRRLQHVLTAAGFEVACMESAVAALAFAAQKSFAFAVVDLELERPKRLQGLALVKKLRASHCSMRILAVTEHDSFAGVILALRAGAAISCPSRWAKASS